MTTPDLEPVAEELADLFYENHPESPDDCIKLAQEFCVRFREQIAQELLEDGWGYDPDGPEDFDATQRYAAWIVRGRPQEAPEEKL